MSTAYTNIKYGVDEKVLHLISKGESDGRTLNINNKKLLNFSSYSYLGLELDPRIIEGGNRASNKYGTQFGSSRAFVSIDLFQEAEELLSKIFDNNPVLVLPTTALAHLAFLPSAINDNDYVITDQQVHASVQSALSPVKLRGVPTEILKHNRMDILERLIVKLKRKYSKIWYLADGVYSMYGDFAPIHELKRLMDEHEQFNLYIDDAHGMSWTGKNGCGFVMSEIGMHPQMVIATSLNKAFASGGGVLVFPNKEQKDFIRITGGTVIFSTPPSPSILGGIVESAKIHLSEIEVLQKELQDKANYLHDQLSIHNIPNISDKNSPIFYVGTSSPGASFNLVTRMMNEGYHLSSVMFPAVSQRRAGLRFCANINHSIREITSMVNCLAKHYPISLSEEGIEINRLRKDFKLPPLKIRQEEVPRKNKEEVKIIRYNSINKINKEKWNQMFGYSGSFDWDGLKFLEEIYSGNEKKENNWSFYYYVMLNQHNEVILATFLTSCWSKDDMFLHQQISKTTEKERKENPYYYCSKTLMMGSLMTEGNHLYINKKNELWKQSLKNIIREFKNLQSELDINQLILRDFSEDITVKELMLSEGYIAINIPNTNIVEKNKLRWSNSDEYLNLISKNSKKKLKQHVIKYEKYYDIEFAQTASQNEIDKWYELYLNVHSKALELNTFPVPKKMFKEAINNPNWEILKLSIKPEFNQASNDPLAAIGLIYKTSKTYSPMIIGINYVHLPMFKNYRQAIYQAIKRANALNLEKVYMGFTSDIEKRNFGATAVKKVAYTMINNTFELEQLNSQAIISNREAVIS